MLKQRVITAVLLVAVLLPALFAVDARWIAALTAIMLGLAFWEWCRIIHTHEWTARFSALLLMTLASGIWFSHELIPQLSIMMLVVVTGWVWFFAGMLMQGLLFWQRIPNWIKWIWGAMTLLATWLALVQAKLIGVNFLLSILCLVWVADIGAYFAGRAFGRRKLAPALSPGKTWEGVAGATLAVGALGFFWQWLDQQIEVDAASFFTQSSLRWGHVGMALWLVLLASSVMGDLFESMLKRVAGVKDSSGLLPGHGGVLDRIDALLPTLPLALWMLSW